MAQRKKWVAVVFAAAVAVGSVGLRPARADEKKDSEISAIMKKVFKGSKVKPSIVQKASQGKASDDELKTLVESCQAMSKLKPPKGEQADWDERCAKLVKASEALQKGDKTAGADLKAAANCKECHKLHQDE